MSKQNKTNASANASSTTKTARPKQSAEERKAAQQIRAERQKAKRVLVTKRAALVASVSDLVLNGATPDEISARAEFIKPGLAELDAEIAALTVRKMGVRTIRLPKGWTLDETGRSASRVFVTNAVSSNRVMVRTELTVATFGWDVLIVELDDEGNMIGNTCETEAQGHGRSLSHALSMAHAAQVRTEKAVRKYGF